MKIGIVGGGQLGLMLAEAAKPLGIQVFCLSDHEQCPAAKACTIVHGDLSSIEKLTELAEQVDVLTYEWENIPVSVLKQIEKKIPIYPPIKALEIAQDRLAEKKLFSQLGIPTPEFAAVNSLPELLQAMLEIDLPAILKTRRLGYDGKGQCMIKSAADAEFAWQQLNPRLNPPPQAGEKANENSQFILEQYIPFDFEVSLIATRNKAGVIIYYPLAKNQHEEGILRLTLAPYEDEKLLQQAKNYVEKILQHTDYVGTLAVEFFVKNNLLFANEMAPRVHNSGHWTIEGSACSQFENHMRAVADLPLGEATTLYHCAMVNLIGKMPDKQALSTIKNAHLHDYQKSERAGRKLGHVTVLSSDDYKLQQRLDEILEVVDDSVKE